MGNYNKEVGRNERSKPTREKTTAMHLSSRAIGVWR